MTRYARWRIYGIAGLSLALLAWAYWPGLSGPFLFDDYGNLAVLGAHGRIDNWPAFLYFLTSGNADPTGRPIALLSFLLDAHSWPAAPWPFKRTNLVLHLLNASLLACVIARLQAGLRLRRPAMPVSPWTPLVAALLWGAHPFFVSTTLYVVQREAMLPMTFILLALLAWDRAAGQFGRGHIGAGWSWALLGFGTATLLAGLSKANGFLAPLLAGLAYVFFIRPPANSGISKPAPLDRAAILCLAVPSVLVLGYLIQIAWHLWSLPILAGRDWTLPERLLSEPRALWTYVWRMVLPRAGGGGVYVDDFLASHSWTEPATTLPAMLALGASRIGAIALRRRFPIACFGWLFFLAAHLLESSVIPLELYFEHRNYLPAAFLGWPLAHLLLRAGAYPRYRATLAALLVATLLLLSHQRALVWGDSALLGALSAAHESGSARSQVFAARQEIDRGDLAAGLARMRAIQRAQPESVDVAISAVGLECAATGALSSATFLRTGKTLSTAKTWNYGMYQWLQDAARDPGLLRCRGFGLPGISALVTSAEANPQSASDRRKRDLWHVRGRIALAQGRPELALHWFNAALRAEPDPDYALVQAAALGDAGAPALGVAHLDHFQHMQDEQRPRQVRDMAAAHQWLLKHYGYYGSELSYLRGQLQADARKSAMPQQSR